MAPNFKPSVIARDVGPFEIAGVALIGGNIFHGEPSLKQPFHLWPAPGYAQCRALITGLYDASSATHAGGGVCGFLGMQAARAVIGDARARRCSPRMWLAGFRG